MKAIVENAVLFTANNLIENREINKEFSDLIYIIVNAKSESGLRKELNEYGKFRFYTYGFGSSHFWVHQKFENKVQGNRIIFVQL